MLSVAFAMTRNPEGCRELANAKYYREKGAIQQGPCHLSDVPVPACLYLPVPVRLPVGVIADAGMDSTCLCRDE